MCVPKVRGLAQASLEDPSVRVREGGSSPGLQEPAGVLLEERVQRPMQQPHVALATNPLHKSKKTTGSAIGNPGFWWVFG